MMVRYLQENGFDESLVSNNKSMNALMLDTFTLTSELKKPKELTKQQKE